MNTPTVTTKQEGTPGERFPADGAPDVILDGDPTSLDAIQLREGVLVDEAGRRVALVKPQTWY